ncbi:MAG: cytidine deaminase [Actinobacteria bacterium]|nr:cytidine deaminase [Actinomycetota bacterium]
MRGGQTIDEADLLRRARAARERAYAPYTGFRVGAAVATEDGHVVEAASVENAAIGLSTCAERVALQELAASGVRSPVVAVAVVGDGEDPCTPCGACRQTILEFGSDAVVYASGDGGRPLVASIKELLPHAYGPRRFAQGRDH